MANDKVKGEPKGPEILLGCFRKYINHSLSLCLQTKGLLGTFWAFSTLGTTFYFSKNTSTYIPRFFFMCEHLAGPVSLIEQSVQKAVCTALVLKSTEVHKSVGTCCRPFSG